MLTAAEQTRVSRTKTRLGALGGTDTIFSTVKH